MNVLINFPRVIKTRTKGVAILQQHEPKVDNNDPPAKPPTLPMSGNYCFRAFTKMVQANEPSNDLSEFTGFDDDMSIVGKVERYCERTRNGDTAKRCTPTKLSFIGPSELCDGRVLMYDKVHDVAQVYF